MPTYIWATVDDQDIDARVVVISAPTLTDAHGVALHDGIVLTGEPTGTLDLYGSSVINVTVKTVKGKSQ